MTAPVLKDVSNTLNSVEALVVGGIKSGDSRTSSRGLLNVICPNLGSDGTKPGSGTTPIAGDRMKLELIWKSSKATVPADKAESAEMITSDATTTGLRKMFVITVNTCAGVEFVSIVIDTPTIVVPNGG